MKDKFGFAVAILSFIVGAINLRAGDLVGCGRSAALGAYFLLGGERLRGYGRWRVAALLCFALLTAVSLWRRFV